MDGGNDLTLAVNASAINLHDDAFPDVLEGLMRRWRIEPGRLTIEITESAIVSNPENALRNAKRLHDIGVRLSIDDFGTGYSLLSHLKCLPVQELKIDKSFVMNMTRDQGDMVIVRTTIDLAHNLGLEVVAEGVETEEHLDTLRRLECDSGQGFLFGRPMPGEDWPEWMASSPYGIRAPVSGSEHNTVHAGPTRSVG